MIFYICSALYLLLFSLVQIVDKNSDMCINSYHLKSSIDSDELESEIRSRWCHENCYRLLIVVILLISSIITTTSLLILLYVDALKEKSLAEKKKGWIEKWKIVSPYVKKFPLGFLLGFIQNLIVLAIERQIEFQ